MLCGLTDHLEDIAVNPTAGAPEGGSYILSQYSELDSHELEILLQY